jgi:hypothetical protein
MADYQDRWQTAKEVRREIEPRDGIGDGAPPDNVRHGVIPPKITHTTYSTHYRKFSSELPEYAYRRRISVSSESGTEPRLANRLSSTLTENVRREGSSPTMYTGHSATRGWR